jgi:hypothetical protein
MIAGGKGYFEEDEDYICASGEVIFANGDHHHALLVMDQNSSYELSGVWILSGGFIADKATPVQLTTDQLKFLSPPGLTTKDIWPFRYRYYDKFSGDHHVGPDGWNR